MFDAPRAASALRRRIGLVPFTGVRASSHPALYGLAVALQHPQAISVYLAAKIMARCLAVKRKRELFFGRPPGCHPRPSEALASRGEGDPGGEAATLSKADFQHATYSNIEAVQSPGSPSPRSRLTALARPGMTVWVHHSNIAVAQTPGSPSPRSRLAALARPGMTVVAEARARPGSVR